MLRKTIALICPLLMLFSCSWFQEDPPPPAPPEPTRVVIQLDASGDVNPNPNGRPSPLMVRIYQLKSYSAFEKTSFLPLYENDKQALGGDLIHKQEILLKPNEKRTIFYEPGDDTKAIGLIALFRNYGLSKWRAVARVLPNKTTVIRAYISDKDVTIR